jgi:hypothetical protein
MQDGNRRKHPKSLIVTLLKTVTFGSNMVMEDHRSSKGVILDLDSEPYNETTNAKGTTITNDMDYLTNQLGSKTTVSHFQNMEIILCNIRIQLKN